MVNSSLTVEPFAKSSLSFEKTTNNVDFLRAHQERLIHLTSFDASLGMEANVAVNLSALGYSWDPLPSTCVLGTGTCLKTFDDIELFSIPKLDLTSSQTSGGDTNLKLEITDGVFNPFNSGAIEWEVFPDDATITPGSCSKSGTITSCNAKITLGNEDEYTVFASGHGKLGDIGRQFKETIVYLTQCDYSGFNNTFIRECFSPDRWADEREQIYRVEGGNRIGYVKRQRQITNNNEETITFYYNVHRAKNLNPAWDASDDFLISISEGATGDNDDCVTCTYTGTQDCLIDEDNGKRRVVYSGPFESFNVIWESSCIAIEPLDAAGWGQANIGAYQKVYSMIKYNLAEELYTGSCHDWWDHEDENEVLQTCSY